MWNVKCKIYNNSEEVIFPLYHAHYLSFAYSPAEYEVESLWSEKSLTPIYFETKQKYDKLKINVYFKKANLADISKFSEQLKNCEIILDSELTGGKTFQCILKSSDVVKASSHIYTVAFDFDCLIFGEEHEIDVTSATTSFSVYGAKETEAIISFENTTDLLISPASINEYSVINLLPSEKIIIDGVKKLVTSNGQNAYDRTSFFNFPRFKPGENAITVTGGAKITIQYRERY